MIQFRKTESASAQSPPVPLNLLPLAFLSLNIPYSYYEPDTAMTTVMRLEVAMNKTDKK